MSQNGVKPDPQKIKALIEMPSPDPQKIKALIEMPPPKNKEEYQALLGY